jgi:hypothetical protein
LSIDRLNDSPSGAIVEDPTCAETSSKWRGPPIVCEVRRTSPTPAAKISSSKPASAQFEPMYCTTNARPYSPAGTFTEPERDLTIPVAGQLVFTTAGHEFPSAARKSYHSRSLRVSR